MGIGLLICRTIVEALGCRIWFDRAPAGGAVFHFTLPLGEAKT
jgi:two-component system sensor histidine kinase KdpD